MNLTRCLLTVAGVPSLALAILLSQVTLAQAAIVCTLKKGNTTVQISMGHNNPQDTYRQINGGGWTQISGTAAQNCAKYCAKGYK